MDIRSGNAQRKYRETKKKYKERDKNSVKICVCQEFCVSLSSDLDKKKDESKMDRVGE